MPEFTVTHEESAPASAAEPAIDPNRLPEVYACVWRSHKTDEEDDHSEFQSRLPRLMVWLNDLREKGKLLACGGGGWENHMGGLTLLKADSYEEALELSNGTPMNEIGSTEIFIWDVYYADLVVPRTFSGTA